MARYAITPVARLASGGKKLPAGWDCRRELMEQAGPGEEPDKMKVAGGVRPG